MQTPTSPMQTALAMRSSTALASISRQPVLLTEIYPLDYFPAAGSGFDPANALALFSEVGITWLGRQYARYINSRGDVSRYITTQFNSVTLNFANNDLYMSAFVIAHDIEGYRVVLRYIDRAQSATLADSIVIAVNRLKRPTTLNEEQCTLDSQQELGSVNWDVPRRTFSAQDPNGRSASDPSYEGFQFSTIQGVTHYSTVVNKRYLLFFSKKKLVISSQQWTSEEGTTQDQIVPLVFGRCQLELLPVLWADVGYFVAGLFVAAGHKVTSITTITVQSPNFLVNTDGTKIFPEAYFNGADNNGYSRRHLGDPGGYGTNRLPEKIINNVLAPGGWFSNNTALLSRTAYIGVAPFGPESPTASFPNQGEDAVPTITGIVMGEVDLPNSAGVFEQSVTSITRSGATVTVTKTAHGYVTGQTVRISGADQLDYNGLPFEITVVDADHFTFAVTGTPATPATGTLTMVRRGFSDNPAFIARFVLVNSDLCNRNPLLIDDAEIIKSAAICDQMLKDETNAEMLILADADKASLLAGDFTRFYSTGVINSAYQKFLINGSNPDPRNTPRVDDVVGVSLAPIPDDGSCAPGSHPMYIDGLIECVPNCGAGFHNDPITGECVPNGIGGILVPTTTFYRKRATFNCPLTAAVKAVDFLFNTLLPAFRGYTVIGADGRIKVKTETPADSTFVWSNTAPGATSVPVSDCELWRASLQGLILIGANLVTGETRTVTAARYSTAGNSIPLVAAATGGATLTRSGATLAGCDGVNTPASGTLTVGGSPANGDTITATINDVEVVHVFSGDSTGSAAGMLATAINSDWELKSYIRAAWNPASPNVITLYSKVGNLTVAALTNAHTALLDSPTAAPVAVGVSGGSMIAGTYTLAYSYRSATGETFTSPSVDVAITAGQKISVSAITPLPGGVASVNWYLSRGPGDSKLGFLVNNFGAAFVINVLPLANANAVPVDNSAGEETIRVMASFTQENILRGKFTWPLADKQSSINQVIGTYTDASLGFVRKEIRVNDYAHQAQVGAVNSVTIDLSGVDNFFQTSLLLNAALSKYREGNFFCSWDTDEAGILFEEGDVVCCSDISGGFVNMPVRIEELLIHDDLTTTFTARLYSTLMLSDQAGQHHIELPTSLKYLNVPPPVATNLVLTETFSGALRGDFDFGGFGAIQRAGLYLKRNTAPADADFRRVDTILPDVSGGVAQAISALTRSGATATATCAGHGFLSGRLVAIAGAGQAEYNGTFAVTVIDEDHFSFTVTGTPATPATGTITGTTTGSHGSFELAGLADGEYQVKVITESVFGYSAASGHPVGTITIRPLAMTDSRVIVDGTNDYLIEAIGHPRPSDTPAYVCEVWTDESRDDPANLKRTLPMVNGTTKAALLSADYTTYDPGTGEFQTSSWAFKNNLFSTPYFGSTVNTIESTFQRFDFSMKYVGTSDGTGFVGDGSTGRVVVALQTRASITGGVVTIPTDYHDCPLSVEWTTGLADDDIPGTIIETFRFYNIVVAQKRNVDPGWGGISIVSGDIVETGRRGPRYTFLLNGNEVAVYREFNPAGGNIPIYKATLNPMPYPLRLVANSEQLPAGDSSNQFAVRSVMFGGSTIPGTIYAAREQEEDFGSEQATLYLRLYQLSAVPGIIGIPLDLVVP